jgi:hypothetical protein
MWSTAEDMKGTRELRDSSQAHLKEQLFDASKRRRYKL